VGSSSKPPHVREEEWQTVLRRATDLVGRDQLKLLHVFSDYLGADLWKETERAQQARLRYEAVETLRVAAQHLGLPNDQPLNIPQFKRAARETALPMSFGAVYDAFERHWDLAERFYRGERIPETAAQRRMRRTFLGRRQGAREAPLTGVRLFLTQDPAPTATRSEDYEAWAREFNENPPDGYARVSENAWHISSMLGLGWDHLVEVAAGRKELQRAQRESLSAALSEAGPPVGHRLAARCSASRRTPGTPSSPTTRGRSCGSPRTGCGCARTSRAIAQDDVTSRMRPGRCKTSMQTAISSACCSAASPERLCVPACDRRRGSGCPVQPARPASSGTGLVPRCNAGCGRSRVGSGRCPGRAKSPFVGFRDKRTGLSRP